MLQEGLRATTRKNEIPGFVSVDLGCVLLSDPPAMQWELLPPKETPEMTRLVKRLPFQGLLGPSGISPGNWQREKGQTSTTVPMVGGMGETLWKFEDEPLLKSAHKIFLYKSVSTHPQPHLQSPAWCVACV